MFINNFDPVAFNIFSLEIRWYSLSYIFGLVIGWYYCKKITSDKFISNIFDDFISYLVIAIIIGGRLGYVFLYNPTYYLKNPIEILMIWNGGMSFHGALIGIIIASYIFGNKKNINNFIFLDLVAISAPIGIFFGRISNFINSELYGRSTDIFWSVKFIKIDQLTRHPSQIYEAIFEGIILFIILNLFFKKLENRPGLISSFFLIFYSFFRFFIEFTREADSQIGYLIFNLTMGQIISMLFFIAGISLFYLKNEKKQ
mgnify:FL=1|tara:strand:+ start:92 stop:862 length:771 start_codon:yes stop_codon:yes gene_type:complete